MYYIICNPTAGKGRSAKLLEKLELNLSSRKIDYVVYRTSRVNHAREITEEICDKVDNLICMGGDGTLHEVLNGLSESAISRINLGLIPCGTGNDFARSAGIPIGDAIAAMSHIIGQKASKVDYIKLNDIRVMNVTGMGMDVEVLERCSHAKYLTGKIQYYKALLVSLCKFKWNKYKVSIDGGERVFHSAMITAVCNGKYFGGGMQISPKSEIADNKLDVIIVNQVPRYKIPLALIGFFTGKLLEYKFVDHMVCEKVEFITDAKPIINADGELVYNQSFCCQIVPNQLNFYL